MLEIIFYAYVIGVIGTAAFLLSRGHGLLASTLVGIAWPLILVMSVKLTYESLRKLPIEEEK